MDVAAGEGNGVGGVSGEGVAEGEGVTIGEDEGVAEGEGVTVGEGVSPGAGVVPPGTTGPTGIVSVPLILMVVARETSTAKPKMRAMMMVTMRTAREISFLPECFERKVPQALNSVAVVPITAASRPMTSLIRISCFPF